MGLSKYEQEVVINFNAEDAMCTLYTANPVWIRKMDTLVQVNPQEFRQIDAGTIKGQIISKTYEFPKKLITVRSKTRTLTEDEKREQSKYLHR